MEYLNRIVDDELEKKLKSVGAILIRGPKWCGKTTTGRQFSKSILELQNPDDQDMLLEIAKIKPSELLKGEMPRLIDEWQICPNLWDAIRYDVDKSDGEHKFILTGSTIIPFDKIKHSGIGRFSFIDMKSLTLYESGHSNGKISLKDIVSGKTDLSNAESDINFDDVINLICTGGWPGGLKLDLETKLRIPYDYINVLCESDILMYDKVKRNSSLAKIILKSYARSVSSIDSNKTIIDDVLSKFPDTNEKVIRDYLKVFENLYIIEEIPGWNPNIRSKTSIRTSSKKSFVDPSLAVAALNCTPEDLKKDLNTLGLLFENMVNRDLSVYSKPIGGEFSHYRDRYGLECKNVIHLPNGKIMLIEIKFGSTRIEEADENLKRLKSALIKNKIYLEKDIISIIIIGFGKAYQKESGALVLPIGCLKD